MTSFIRTLVNTVLSPFNIRVVCIPRNAISGFLLFEDLKKVINTESPVCLDVGANKGQTIDSLLECACRVKLCENVRGTRFE